jgi:tetratricopeptide (TPR) repeat protein
MNVLESRIENQHRVINPRAAVIVAITAVVLLFGMRKLHDRQFGKTIDFLRHSAYASLESRDYLNAQMRLNQYLAFRSADMDARQKLSSLLSTHIRTRPALEQAFQLNEDLLRNDLPQQELRLEQSRIAVELGRCSDARAHLQFLQKLQADSAEVWYLSGHCAKEARHTDEAVRFYQRALTCKNTPEQAFRELAMLAKFNPHLMLDSEGLLDQMVIDCNTAESRRLRAMAFVEQNRFSEALPHAWKGLETAPDDVALNAILVNCLQRIDAPEKSQQLMPQLPSIENNVDLLRGIGHLRGCVERNPNESSFYIHLAALLWKNLQQADAILVLEEGITRNSRTYPLHGVLIEYLLTQDQADKAERLLQSLPVNALVKSEREILCGRIHMLRKEWKNADASLQRAVAYSEPGSSLQQHAQMLLAVCHSNSGDSTTAVDAYRSILAATPDSVAGRLGMASAWIKAGRKDLAIAEYRQLLDVPGVPAFLADLMIQRNLEQPVRLRDWDAVADLVRESNPFIANQTQRTLLQIDMLMASGRLTEGVYLLEDASATNPANVSFQRALALLTGERSGELEHRLNQLAIEVPENNDVLAALIRLYLSSNNKDKALALLENISSGQRNPGLRPTDSLLLAIRTAERVLSLETHLGRTQYVEHFHDAVRRYAGHLTLLDSGYEATLVRVLAQQGHFSEAINRVKRMETPQTPAIKANALMALVQYAAPRQSVMPDAIRELLAMIEATPNSIALRICYADILMYDAHLETASQVLEQIQNAPPDDGEVKARQAWILAVTGGSVEKALDLIMHAIQRQPENIAFRVIEGRVLLAAGRYAEVLSKLNELEEQSLSQAALTYQAAALLEMNETSEARRTIERIRLEDVRDAMFPADEEMLRTVQNRLTQFATASRAQP